MRNSIRIIALVAIAISFYAAVSAQTSTRISDIQARLFNSKTGDFSPNIFGPDPPELGNVIIGEYASTSTFVVVEVKVARGVSIPLNATVRLVATESGKAPFGGGRRGPDRVILNSVSKLGLVEAGGTTNVGFWLNDTGCRVVKLKATLTGFGRAAPLEKEIPFVCYE